MIVTITEDTARIGFRLNAPTYRRYVADWRKIQLRIHPGQLDGGPRPPNGSPWFLHGCWLGYPTEVDVANSPMPDFPTMTIPAHAMGDECDVEFLLPERFKQLPFGRYTGVLQFNAGKSGLAIGDTQHDTVDDAGAGAPAPRVPNWLCESMLNGAKKTPAPNPAPHPPFTLLNTFDIDYGPRPDEHIIDIVTVREMVPCPMEEI